MEGLQSFNFHVSSLKGKYQVCFDSFSNTISELIEEGDFIICDEFFKKKAEKVVGSRVISIQSSEKAKDFENLSFIISELIDNSFSRNNKIIAIGGGVIQDICGFISSILFRGVEWIFYPTTLLSQGDSCIGSKTSINFKGYKNQIGNFYPPSKIIIDTDFLKSLPEEEIRSGMGEMAHYFLIELGDHYQFFKNNFNDKTKINEIIFRSLQIKKEMIEKDEFDTGERIIFNYGHSFGHAIESLTNYKVPHGIAVANGIDIANYISMSAGDIKEGDYEEMRELVSNFWNHPSLESLFIRMKISSEDFVDRLRKDKKSVNGKIGLILPKEKRKEYVLIEDNELIYYLLSSYFKKRTEDG